MTGAAPDIISVIMVSYHTGPALPEAICAVLEGPDIGELFLIDNGNDAASYAQINAMREALNDERLYLIQGHGNVGFARACNYGAALSGGEHLLFLNPDAVIAPGAAALLRDGLRGLSSPALIGGCIRDENGHEQRGGRRGRLTLKGALLDMLPFSIGQRALQYDRSGGPMPDDIVPMPTISGAFFMMDRESFKRVGGFDESYFLHVEDIDLCDRVWQAGGAAAFHPKAEALHYGATSNASPLKVQAHKLRSLLRYFWRSGGTLTKIATVLSAPALAVALILKGFTARTPQPPIA